MAVETLLDQLLSVLLMSGVGLGIGIGVRLIWRKLRKPREDWDY